MAKRKPVKISKVEAAEAHKQVTAFLAQELPNRGLKKLLSKFRGDRKFGQRFATKQYTKFLAEGGKARDWPAFWKALLENLPALIELLMKLFKPAI